MSNVISLQSRRIKKWFDDEIAKWEKEYSTKPKMDLLYAYAMFEREIIDFGVLTDEMICQGIPLFKILNQKADTLEFAQFTAERRNQLMRAYQDRTELE